MEAIKTIKWGIIGCGNVTEVKSGPAFSKVVGSELIAVMRRDAKKAKNYARRHDVERWYSDADDLLADPEVNAVYIATPPDSHAAYAIKAMKAGKAVYCEKPMALSSDECSAMLAASKEYQQPLYVAYYRRGQDYFHKVKALIEEGRLGQVLTVNLRLMKSPKPEDLSPETLTWRVKPEIAGGGYFIDLAPHQLDILQYLLGRIEEVQSVVSNQMNRYDAEDVVSVVMHFQSGIVGNALWSFNVPEVINEDVIEIIGTQGKVSFSTFDYTPIVLHTEKGEEVFDIAPPYHAQEPYIGMIVSELLTQKKSLADLDMAIHTTRLTDQILSDYYSK